MKLSTAWRSVSVMGLLIACCKCHQSEPGDSSLSMEHLAGRKVTGGAELPGSRPTSVSLASLASRRQNADDSTLVSGYCTQLSEAMDMYDRVHTNDLLCSSIWSEPAGLDVSSNTFSVNISSNLREKSVVTQLTIYVPVPVTLASRDVRMRIKARKGVGERATGWRTVAMTPRADSTSDVICMRGQLGKWMQRGSQLLEFRVLITCPSQPVACRELRGLHPFIIIEADETAYGTRCF